MCLDRATIIVPTRNEEEGIARFLSAIPDQADLVVVDSSDDRTPDIIRRLRPQTWVIPARVNIPEARQIGADAVTSEWLVFCDADVLLAPDYFEILGRLDDDPRIGGFVGTKSTVEGFDLYHRWFQRGQRLFDLVGIPAATGSNMVVRRPALDSVGGFDPTLTVNEDTELMFRLVKGGWRVPFEPRLQVLSFDHRRLEAGVARKLAHGAARNTALYLGVFGRSVRASDWGYWTAQ